jgi:hypothetical protein
LARPVWAETPPAIWYRASEGCPDGAQFLKKLTESARQARLAQAGDHIDFVVTLRTDGKETAGRLERQTDSGIVAIRELRDATCERVADALALSLGLALAPAQAEPKGDKSGSDPWGLVDAPNPTVEAAPPAPPPPPEPSVPVPTAGRGAGAEHAAVPPRSAPPPPPDTRSAWSLGFGFGAMIGISTHPLPRAEIFIDSNPALSRVLSDLSLRAGVIAAWGSSETSIGPVQRWILTSRGEACPVAWRAGRVDLRPCVAFELGATGVSADRGSGMADRSLWAAPAGQVRLAVALEPRWLSLEISGGALVPLIRNEIYSGSKSLYRDAAAVFHASVGVSLRLP